MSYVFIAFLVLFAIPYTLIRLKFDSAMRDSFGWVLKNSGKLLPFSTTKDRGMGKGFIYCPHPFTNWSLNPSYVNRFEESNHTREGFRKTDSGNSIIRMLREYPDASKVVCIGGSTTYCTKVTRYQDTWPARLKEKLGSDTLVFNFGVGGWSTLQSVIRCVSWLPIVRPHLLIFYQAKNDLTPLYNGAEKENVIFPDYQNIMGQFAESFCLRFPRWLSSIVPFFYFIELRRLRKNGLLCVYQKPKSWINAKGFERLDNDMLSAILFRIEALINMCAMIDCKVLYIPEVVRSGPYAFYLNEIYGHISEILRKYSNVSLFDIRNALANSDRYFQDKMHFNEEGCEVFADAVATEIKKIMRNLQNSAQGIKSGYK